MRKNSVKVHSSSGIIELTVAGLQDRHSVELLTKEAVKASEEVATKFDQVLILVDCSLAEDLKADTEKAALRAFKAASFDRVAVLVRSKSLQNGLELLAKLSGKSQVVHFYSDRAEALAWLEQGAEE